MFIRSKTKERSITYLYEPGKLVRNKGGFRHAITVTSKGVEVTQDEGMVGLQHDDVEEFFPVIVETVAEDVTGDEDRSRSGMGYT